MEVKITTVKTEIMFENSVLNAIFPVCLNVKLLKIEVFSGFFIKIRTIPNIAIRIILVMAKKLCVEYTLGFLVYNLSVTTSSAIKNTSKNSIKSFLKLKLNLDFPT